MNKCCERIEQIFANMVIKLIEDLQLYIKQECKTDDEKKFVESIIEVINNDMVAVKDIVDVLSNEPEEN